MDSIPALAFLSFLLTNFFFFLKTTSVRCMNIFIRIFSIPGISHFCLLRFSWLQKIWSASSVYLFKKFFFDSEILIRSWSLSYFANHESRFVSVLKRLQLWHYMHRAPFFPNFLKNLRRTTKADTVGVLFFFSSRVIENVTWIIDILKKKCCSYIFDQESTQQLRRKHSLRGAPSLWSSRVYAPEVMWAVNFYFYPWNPLLTSNVSTKETLRILRHSIADWSVLFLKLFPRICPAVLQDLVPMFGPFPHHFIVPSPLPFIFRP